MKYSLRSLRIQWRYLGLTVASIAGMLRSPDNWIAGNGIVDTFVWAGIGLLVGWLFELWINRP